MATNRSGHIPGGGLHSKNVVYPNMRTGTGSKSARPAGVSQIGTSWGNHSTALGGQNSQYTGERLHNSRTFQPTRFGNEIAANTVCKPGGSREVMGSGSQGQHGGVAGSPRPQGRGFDERG
jgi:hypothetical protein